MMNAEKTVERLSDPRGSFSENTNNKTPDWFWNWMSGLTPVEGLDEWPDSNGRRIGLAA